MVKECFPIDLQTRVCCHTFIQCCAEDPSQSITRIKKRKEELDLTVFINDTIIHLEISNQSLKTLV